MADIAKAGEGTYMDLDPVSGSPALLGDSNVQAIGGKAYISQEIYDLSDGNVPAPGYALVGAFPAGLLCLTPTAPVTQLSAAAIENPIDMVNITKILVDDGIAERSIAATGSDQGSVGFNKTSSPTTPTKKYQFQLTFTGVTPQSAPFFNLLDLELTISANWEDSVAAGEAAIKDKDPNLFDEEE